MGLQERVYSVLVVSASERFSAALAEFLPEAVYSPVVTASSVSAGERAAAQRSFDFIFINSPLPAFADRAFLSIMKADILIIKANKLIH